MHPNPTLYRWPDLTPCGIHRVCFGFTNSAGQTHEREGVGDRISSLNHFFDISAHNYLRLGY